MNLLYFFFHLFSKLIICCSNNNFEICALHKLIWDINLYQFFEQSKAEISERSNCEQPLLETMWCLLGSRHTLACWDDRK